MGASSFSSDSGLKDGTQASCPPRMCFTSELHLKPSSHPSLGLKLQRSYSTCEFIFVSPKMQELLRCQQVFREHTQGQRQPSLSSHTRKFPLHWTLGFPSSASLNLHGSLPGFCMIRSDRGTMIWKGGEPPVPGVLQEDPVGKDLLCCQVR